MVCHWGMSERLGPINYAKQSPGPMVYGESVTFSDETSRKIDLEIANFVQKNYEVAKKILQDNMTALHRLTDALVLWETLDSEQIKEIVSGKDIGAPVMGKKTVTTPPEESAPSAPVFGTKPTPA
jgi:cell division protease FtsH